MYRVGILGALGFTGRELLKILAAHPEVELVYATSTDFAGKTLAEALPQLDLTRYAQLKLSSPQDFSWPKLDLVFLCTPEDVSLQYVPHFLQQNIKVIDLSGAFRLRNEEIFQEYYNTKHLAEFLLEKAVYGLPELKRDSIRKAHLIANPGCYPTAVLLSLAWLGELFDAFENWIIVDAKSGTSGAGGRREKDTLVFSQVYENFKPYRLIKHQHVPEMEQEAALLAQKAIHIRFTPYLLPLYRGILTTVYLHTREKLSLQELQKKASLYAAKESFVRYCENPDMLELQKVQHTNFFDFSFYFDEKTGLLEIVSAIDNLRKGAAGQAVQNMNLMLGLRESAALL
ncbi:MAG: N-acetyl-gamma-glutamyl-phosphate reductase [Leptospiraceae bacterium]|nr:N-acetyl-gamma-glutamyl-phosphate reductase [Leptospiraceae bacterium]MDW8307476.1 N-acetyl-gamma-glutamyl-phosphate reductase [Leptospiraceae bacterium]